jgi:hypothetical protein
MEGSGLQPRVRSKILLKMAGQGLTAGTRKYETEGLILHSAVPQLTFQAIEGS